MNKGTWATLIAVASLYFTGSKVFKYIKVGAWGMVYVYLFFLVLIILAYNYMRL